MQPNHFKTLKILHSALLGGLAFFTLIAFVVQKQGLMIQQQDDTFEIVFQAIAAIMSITSLLAGFNIFKKRLVEVHNNRESAETRMDMYRAACILWWALLEGPGLFAIIAYVLIGNTVFIILALFHLALLTVFMPRKDNIVLLLNLTTDEVHRLEGKQV